MQVVHIYTHTHVGKLPMHVDIPIHIEAVDHILHPSAQQAELEDGCELEASLGYVCVLDHPGLHSKTPSQTSKQANRPTDPTKKGLETWLVVKIL